MVYKVNGMLYDMLNKHVISCSTTVVVTFINCQSGGEGWKILTVDHNFKYFRQFKSQAKAQAKGQAQESDWSRL